MKFRITSEGTARTTKLLLPDGRDFGEMASVSSIRIDWHNGPPGVIHAHLDVLFPEVDVEAEGELYATVDGKRYKLVPEEE